MPFYGDEFWESDDVLALSNEAALLYSRLLWMNWKRGSIPATPALIRELAGARFVLHFEALWEEVRPLFGAVSKCNTLCNKRISELLSDRETLSTKRARAGKASAKSRKNKGLRTHVDHLLQQTSNTEKPFAELQEERRGEKRRLEEVKNPPGSNPPRAPRAKPPAKAGPPSCPVAKRGGSRWDGKIPDDLEPLAEQIRGFDEMRCSLKPAKPLTPYAAKLVFRALRKHSLEDAGRALDICSSNGWVGIQWGFNDLRKQQKENAKSPQSFAELADKLQRERDDEQRTITLEPERTNGAGTLALLGNYLRPAQEREHG